jgi:hypothetical protein
VSRPIGPKKLAAIEQANKLRAAGVKPADIRQALIDSGLTKAQANEVVAIDESEFKPAPMAPVVKDDAFRTANIEGAIHFLETIAKRLTPNVCDRFNELTEVKQNALTWARKLKGTL